MKARLLILLFLLALGAGLPWNAFVQELEEATVDIRFRIRGPVPPRAKVVVVAFDDATERGLRPLPKAMWGGELARVVREAYAAGAKAVALDFVMTADADNYLAGLGIDQSPNADLIGSMLETGNRTILGTATGDDLDEAFTVVSPPLPIASVNGVQSDRRIVRELPMEDRTLRPPLPGLAAALAARQGSGVVGINYSGGGLRVVSAREVARADLRDAYVLVGETYAASGDFHDTPFGTRVPGVFIHAEAVQTILDGKSLRATSPVAGSLAGLAVAGVFAWAAFLVQPYVYLLAAGVTGLLWSVVGQMAFSRAHFVLPWVSPVGLALLAVPVCVYAVRAVEERQERLWARAMWGQMMPEGFVERLERGRSVGLGDYGSFEAALLFLDVAGFSERQNRLPAPEVIERLNEIFAFSIAAIGAGDGVVLNFMGDGISAMFEGEEGRERALAAARRTLKEIDAYRADGHDWNVRIGLGFGEVTLALVGTPGRRQMTIYGAAMNMAARLEQAGKDFGSRLVATADYVPGDAEKWEDHPYQPKGWPDPVIVRVLREG